MVQGTTSDAGKSLLVAGLCRLLARRGVSVAPFKPQNMALNSAVTREGGEIGRAQALQAQAAFLEPSNDMNPVLIKPEADKSAQIVVQGKVFATMDASRYHDYKRKALDFVMASYARLRADHDAIIVEGAGSPAEINLRANDIANMGFAEAADCPVLLVADIDRGGVFATVVGTLALLSESERHRVRGVVINRFRGDIGLLEPGLRWLEERIRKPVLGVLPYLHGLYLDQEDAIDPRQELRAGIGHLQVAVIALPRISNHTDFDPLRLHPAVDLSYVPVGGPLPACDLVILPGSKNVRGDLAALRKSGLDEAIVRHLRYGGRVMGICGGFQMLGTDIADPDGVEGTPGASHGLGLLDLVTELKPGKHLLRRRGRLALPGGDNAAVRGYEIHCGESNGSAMRHPLVRFEDGGVDGAVSRDGQVIGAYLHGLFDDGDALGALLAWAGLETDDRVDVDARRDAQLDRVADTIAEHVQVERLFPHVFPDAARQPAWNA